MRRRVEFTRFARLVFRRRNTLSMAVMKTNEQIPIVGVIMGSRSDEETMAAAAAVLNEFGVPHEVRIVSAHRTPAWMAEYAAGAADRGLEVIIAGAGGAAHLPGMVAAQTRLPVLGVPVRSRALNGLDSLLSIVQMPQGVPVAALAIGSSGARNAGLLAVRILALARPKLQEQLEAYARRQTEAVLADSVISEQPPSAASPHDEETSE